MDTTFEQRKRRDSQQMRSKHYGAGNERGVALVLALVMLLVLGVIGAMSMNTTTTELRIAGNYRNSAIGFYNANVVEAFSPLNVDINTALNPYGNPRIVTMPNLGNCPAGMTPQSTAGNPGPFANFCAQPMPAGFLGSVWVRVEFLCMSLGKKEGNDTEKFAEFHYLVTTVGRDATNAEYVSETEFIMYGGAPLGVEQDCIDNT